jgi:hypothetical protein
VGRHRLGLTGKFVIGMPQWSPPLGGGTAPMFLDVGGF